MRLWLSSYSILWDQLLEDDGRALCGAGVGLRMRGGSSGCAGQWIRVAGIGDGVTRHVAGHGFCVAGAVSRARQVKLLDFVAVCGKSAVCLHRNTALGVS